MKWVRLGAVARIQTGLTLDSGREMGATTVVCPYLRVANVQNGRIDFSEIKEVEVPEALALRSQLVPGDVLMTEGGDPDKLGRGTVWQGEIERCLHQNHVFAVRSTEALLPRYLALVTQTHFARAYFESTASKTTGIASTSVSKIASFKIPLPPIDEQQRVVDQVDAETARIDALVTKKRRMIGLLLVQDRAVIDAEADALFEKFGSAPFGRSIRQIEQGWSPQCDNVAATDGEWGVLKVSSVKNGEFTETENKRLPDDTPPDLRYKLFPGDLLITRANTPALVGSVAMVPEITTDLLLCDKIFRINIGDDLNKEFFAYLSRTTRIRDLCASQSHGTSQSMANLKSSDIKDWPVPAAPYATQRETAARISRRLDRSRALQGLNSRQIGLLQEHRQALITAAVQGSLTA